MKRVVWNPYSMLLFIIFIVIILVLVPLLFLSIIGATFAKLGFSWLEALIILAATLLGSFINIPVNKVQNTSQISKWEYSPLYGRLYRIVPSEHETTTVAVNLGGAVIPTLISIYLLVEGVILPGLAFVPVFIMGIFVVTVITNRVARPVPGLGIATPFFIPPSLLFSVG